MKPLIVLVILVGIGVGIYYQMPKKSSPQSGIRIGATVEEVDKVLVCVGRRPVHSTVPFSVGMSLVSMMSLSPTGTPCSGPSARPARCSSSHASAWARAWAGSRKRHASTAGSRAAIRARHASVRVRADSEPPSHERLGRIRLRVLNGADAGREFYGRTPCQAIVS